MAETRDTIDDLPWRTKNVTSRVESKVIYHQDFLLEYMDIKNVINGLTEQKEKMEQKHHAIQELVVPMEQQLVVVGEELEEAKEECAAAKVELVQVKEQLAQKNRELDEMNKELQALRKKLQESKAMDAQLEQRHGSAPEPVQSTRETRSMQKRKLTPQGSLGGNDADKHRLKKQRSCPQPLKNLTAGQPKSSGDDLEVVRQKLIKGFVEIDGATRCLGIKEMGKLNKKPFLDACAKKLPHKESVAEASKLYTLWEELLNNPEWNPFKTDIVDGNHQEEVINVDDDELQGLKMAWGEGPYNAVISALMERKEYNTDGAGVFDLWNYKEGRKATLGKCVEYIFSRLKKFRQFHLRTLRSKRHCVC